MRTVVDSVCFFKTEGSSDKEYQLRLVSVDGGWMVEYSNGRRGSALRPGARTEKPVDEQTARKLYESVKKSKLKDGYTQDESGVSYLGTEFAGQLTGFKPQLLSACAESDILPALENPRRRTEKFQWAMQIKHDGERRGVRVDRQADGSYSVIGSNRQGFRVPVTEAIEGALIDLASNLDATCLELDCEDMGRYLAVFDLLNLNGADYRSKGFVRRMVQLTRVMRSAAMLGLSDKLLMSEVNWAPTKADIDRARDQGEEGVVFKLIKGSYFEGRSKMDFKLKFWETATARVKSAHATKRSVSMEMLNEQGIWVAVGSVPVPPNVKVMPDDGQLIEVRYLYAYPGGSLFQPSFIKVRSDLLDSDATLSQLKFKTSAELAVA